MEHDANQDDRLLKDVIRSMPDPYQEAARSVQRPDGMHWLETQYEIREHARQVFVIAIDMLTFLHDAFDGVAPVVLTLVDRNTIRHGLRECIEGKRDLSSVVAGASQIAGETYEKAHGFLFEGKMKVAECLMLIKEPGKSFFEDVLLLGSVPSEFREILGDRLAPRAADLFHAVVERMRTLTSIVQ